MAKFVPTHIAEPQAMKLAQRWFEKQPSYNSMNVIAAVVISREYTREAWTVTMCPRDIAAAPANTYSRKLVLKWNVNICRWRVEPPQLWSTAQELPQATSESFDQNLENETQLLGADDKAVLCHVSKYSPSRVASAVRNAVEVLKLVLKDQKCLWHHCSQTIQLVLCALPDLANNVAQAVLDIWNSNLNSCFECGQRYYEFMTCQPPKVSSYLRRLDLIRIHKALVERTSDLCVCHSIREVVSRPDVVESDEGAEIRALLNDILSKTPNAMRQALSNWNVDVFPVGLARSALPMLIFFTDEDTRNAVLQFCVTKQRDWPSNTHVDKYIKTALYITSLKSTPSASKNVPLISLHKQDPRSVWESMLCFLRTCPIEMDNTGAADLLYSQIVNFLSNSLGSDQTTVFLALLVLNEVLLKAKTSIWTILSGISKPKIILQTIFTNRAFNCMYLESLANFDNQLCLSTTENSVFIDEQMSILCWCSPFIRSLIHVDVEMRNSTILKLLESVMSLRVYTDDTDLVVYECLCSMTLTGTIEFVQSHAEAFCTRVMCLPRQNNTPESVSYSWIQAATTLIECDVHMRCKAAEGDPLGRTNGVPGLWNTLNTLIVAGKFSPILSGALLGAIRRLTTTTPKVLATSIEPVVTCLSNFLFGVNFADLHGFVKPSFVDVTDLLEHSDVLLRESAWHFFMISASCAGEPSIKTIEECFSTTSCEEKFLRTILRHWSSTLADPSFSAARGMDGFGIFGMICIFEWCLLRLLLYIATVKNEEQSKLFSAMLFEPILRSVLKHIDRKGPLLLIKKPVILSPIALRYLKDIDVSKILNGDFLASMVSLAFTSNLSSSLDSRLRQFSQAAQANWPWTAKISQQLQESETQNDQIKPHLIISDRTITLYQRVLTAMNSNLTTAEGSSTVSADAAQGGSIEHSKDQRGHTVAADMDLLEEDSKGRSTISVDAVQVGSIEHSNDQQGHTVAADMDLLQEGSEGRSTTSVDAVQAGSIEHSKDEQDHTVAGDIDMLHKTVQQEKIPQDQTISPDSSPMSPISNDNASNTIETVVVSSDDSDIDSNAACSDNMDCSEDMADLPRCKKRRRVIEAQNAVGSTIGIRSDFSRANDATNSGTELVSRILVRHEKPSVPGVSHRSSSPSFAGKYNLPLASAERFKATLQTILDADGENLETTDIAQNDLKLPDAFDSYESYQISFDRLLQLECRTQMHIAGSRNLKMEPFASMIIDSINKIDQHMTLLVRGRPASWDQIERAVVVIGPVQDHHETSKCMPTPKPYLFGYVSDVKVANQGMRQLKILSVYPQDHKSPRYKMIDALKLGQRVSIRFLTSLVSTIRQFEAVHLCAGSPLLNYILPKPGSPYDVATTNTSKHLALICASTWQDIRPVFQQELNASQMEAIQTVVDNRSPMVMIQGPPGSGKSTTLVALIAAIFHRSGASDSKKQKKFSRIREVSLKEGTSSRRILICAPSNAAIDELVRRIANGIHIGEHETKVKILRTGNIKHCHPSALPFTLDKLAEKEISATSESAKQKFREYDTLQKQVQEQNRQIEELSCKIEELEKFIKVKGSGSLASDIKSLKQKRGELLVSEQKNSKNARVLKFQAAAAKQRQDDLTKTVRKKITDETQVFCTTLNSSGIEILRDIRFDCVIIDEAAQCIEPDMLIPLRHGCQRLVLFGDHKQLPATVLSQQAERAGLARSFFERAQAILDHPAASTMLRIQYRMHPEICYFPNNHFYNVELETDQSILHRTSPPWLNDPVLRERYILFNADQGLESFGDRDSKFNRYEAHMAVKVIERLKQHYKSDTWFNNVGVITPYNSQKAEIRKAFTAMLGSNSSLISVDTVDGFQGQEKDVIIFSCVRTGSDVGFLREPKRLNVALTRARHGLFIIGKIRTLRHDPLWKALVADASDRYRIKPCDVLSGLPMSNKGRKPHAARQLQEARRQMRQNNSDHNSSLNRRFQPQAIPTRSQHTSMQASQLPSGTVAARKRSKPQNRAAPAVLGKKRQQFQPPPNASKARVVRLKPKESDANFDLSDALASLKKSI